MNRTGDVQDGAGSEWGPGPSGRRQLLLVAKGALLDHFGLKGQATIAGELLGPDDGARDNLNPARDQELLDKQGGAFVSIYRRGSLRGCVGVITSSHPIRETVADLAITAATMDSRFPQLLPEEVEELNLEISLLSPMRPLPNLEQLSLGVHGLCITNGPHRAVMLPQVAPRLGWSREDLVHHTLRKAGLDAASLDHPDTRIEIFEAKVFSG